MKYILKFLALVLIGISVWGCGKSKQNDSKLETKTPKVTTVSDDLKNRLLGKWMIDEKKTFRNDPVFKKGLDENDPMTLNLLKAIDGQSSVEFKSDGRCIRLVYDIRTGSGHTRFEETYRIEKVSNNSITLDIEKEDGTHIEATVTFLENSYAKIARDDLSTVQYVVKQNEN